MKITEKLKKTLYHNGKFLTLSLTIEMLKKCIKLLLEYGISPETISFLNEGLKRISDELIEGYKFVKEKEEFETIMRDVKLDIPPLN